MKLPLSSYANKFIAEKGNELPNKKNMREVLNKCVLPPKEKDYPEIKKIILETQDNVSRGTRKGGL